MASAYGTELKRKLGVYGYSFYCVILFKFTDKTAIGHPLFDSVFVPL